MTLSANIDALATRAATEFNTLRGELPWTRVNADVPTGAINGTIYVQETRGTSWRIKRIVTASLTVTTTTATGTGDSTAVATAWTNRATQSYT